MLTLLFSWYHHGIISVSELLQLCELQWITCSNDCFVTMHFNNLFHFHCTGVGICTWLGVLIDTLSLGYPMPYVSLCKKRCARLNMKPSCTTHAHTAFNPVLRFFLEKSLLSSALKSHSTWKQIPPETVLAILNPVIGMPGESPDFKLQYSLFCSGWTRTFSLNVYLYTVYIILNPVLGGLETVFPAISGL